MNIEDIKRLNYIKYTSYRQLVKEPHSLLYCLLHFIVRVLRTTIFWKNGCLSFNSIIFVVPTLNNQKSVKTIIENLKENEYSVWGKDLKNQMPYSEINLRSLLYLHLFLRLYMNSTREDRLLMRYFSYDFITTCATYKVFEKKLNNSTRLKMIVMANDHVLITRTLIELSEKLKIKSLYVQHASVTTLFPALRFDYSFLDGLESYEKYKAVGNMRGKIYLSGSPRFDILNNYKNNSKKYDIGIALNEFDSEEMALDLCLFLKMNYSSRILVRPHPGMIIPGNLLFHKEKFIGNGFSLSDPSKDDSGVFLSDIKVMIANESGIHLDAIMMGVPTLLYNFSNNEVLDWYSFIKNGLVKKCNTYEEIANKLDCNFDTPLDVARYYEASYNTSREGHVGEIIASFIEKEVFESETSALNYINSLTENKGDYSVFHNYAMHN